MGLAGLGSGLTTVSSGGLAVRSGRSAGRRGRVAGGEVHSCPSEAATAVAARMSWVSLVIAASRSRSAASALPKNSSREGLRLRGAPAALAVAPGLAAGVAVAAGVRGGVRGDDGTPAEKPLASRRLRPILDQPLSATPPNNALQFFLRPCIPSSSRSNLNVISQISRTQQVAKEFT